MLSKNQLKLVRSLELKKNRKREKLFVAEGPKVVGDLLRSGFIPRMVFATEGAQLSFSKAQQPHVNAQQYTPVQLVTDDELHRLSFLQHPQEVLAVMEIPDTHYPSSANSQLSLALDGVQDPGNVGTIIRIADWYGMDAVYCSPDTADIYSPKVVQATMGSLAHVPIIYCDLVELLGKAKCPVYGTLLDGSDIYTQPLSPHGIIVMGNEGNGISAPVRSLVSHRLLIPNFNKGVETAESLNVAIATAITCSEFRRRY